MKKIIGAIKRGSYLLRAALWATVLGIIETCTSARGRRILALVALGGVAIGFLASKPIRSIEPGEVGIRVNKLTGAVTELSEGWAWQLPGIHRMRRFPLRDQVYRPADSTEATARAAYQSLEGLSIGVEVSVRYALDPAQIETLALELPEELDDSLVEPLVDGVLHRTFAKHTVQEIFSSNRSNIEAAIREELHNLLKKDGVIVRDVFLGNVDLPSDYKAGLEGLLTAELNNQKMRYTLELKEKQIEESKLMALAEKVRREKVAEASALEQVIAARARAEAMQHVLPLKEKEIEQRRLEAEAAKVVRIKQAEANAASRRIEAAGEADSRRKLAMAEAYRLEVTGKAASEQLARDSELIQENPLLIQKTIADKLSDNIQVIIAPPSQSGFFADGLIGTNR